jgi:hypothetical protein
LTPGRTAACREASLHDRLGHQLDELAGAVGLAEQRSLLSRACELLCVEAGAYPAGGRPLRRSALNADGTPVQLSLTLREQVASVQILSDAGAPELSGRERMLAGRACADELAGAFAARRELSGVATLLEAIAPARDPALLADTAGALWVGAGFAPGRDPTLKLYVNARWGEEGGRWERLERFAAALGAREGWKRARGLVGDELSPLGVALGMRAGDPVVGRIYLGGYGRSWDRLAALAGECGGGAFASRVHRCARELLAAEYPYPSRSVVLSLGVREGGLTDVKVELCGHCAFDSDRQARERCGRWLADDRDASAVYGRVVSILSDGPLSGARATLHSYVGVGSSGERSFYFNPAAQPGSADGDGA